MFDIVSVEDWSSKDFVKYIKAKLEEKGIAYVIKYPKDIIFISKLMKTLDFQGKTRYYMKKNIDDFFLTLDFTSVTSLQFILNIFGQDNYGYRQAREERRVKATEAPKITSALRKRLEGLK
jgi:hypothetical protein